MSPHEEMCLFNLISVSRFSQIEPMTWGYVGGWTGKGGSNLGTKRYDRNVYSIHFITLYRALILQPNYMTIWGLVIDFQKKSFGW